MKRLLLLTSLVFGLVTVQGASSASTEQAWDETLAKVSPSVVSIRVDAPRAFDTEWNLTGQATVTTLGTQHFVTVDTNGVQQRRAVQIGLVGTSETQITSGLQPGESVVVAIASTTSGSNTGRFGAGGAGGFPGAGGGGFTGGGAGRTGGGTGGGR